MTSRSFPPARAVVSAVGVLLLLAGSGAALRAQAPTPAAPVAPGASPAAAATPSPTPRKPAGWVRFWNMTPVGGVRLELVSAADPNKVIAGASNMNVSADYNELPPGRYALQVFRSGDRQTALKNLDVPLRDGSYVTVLAHQPATAAADKGAPVPSPTVTATPAAAPTASPAADPIVVELVDDTPPDLAKAENRLTIRQFIPGERVVVATATKQTTDVLNYGGAQTLAGFPNGVTPLVARASNKTGGNVWNTEAEFTYTWRATLLLINDSYGRFRPRVSNDGPPKPTPTPKP